MLAYLHIPFCHRVCPYCSFYKHTPGGTSIQAFIDAVLIEARQKIAIPTEPPRTLFLGGGTPSMLSPTHLEKLMLGLQEIMDFSLLEEITLEANPATFDLTKARLFRELGVTRVSLGIQSFAASVLQTLGREHDPEQAVRSVEILHEAAIPSINIDLMFSIPGQTQQDWLSSLDQALALKPHHISAYNLTYEEDTAFFQSLLAGEMQIDQDRDGDHFAMAHDRLTAAGYDHYETSNYARRGHLSTHNRGYWRGEDYLGIGPSAVSTVDAVRSKNISDTGRYIDMVQSIGHATAESEILKAEDLRLERIALGLRTREGIAMNLLDETGQRRAHDLASMGLLGILDRQIIVTQNGSALVDGIAGELA
ncbi:MAG: radical family heme chaperone HemW [Verrucomicrobiota bacterium]